MRGRPLENRIGESREPRTGRPRTVYRKKNRHTVFGLRYPDIRSHGAAWRGMARKKLAVFGRIWQKWPERYSLVQVEIFHYTHLKELRKIDPENAPKHLPRLANGLTGSRVNGLTSEPANIEHSMSNVEGKSRPAIQSVSFFPSGLDIRCSAFEIPPSHCLLLLLSAFRFRLFFFRVIRLHS